MSQYYKGYYYRISLFLSDTISSSKAIHVSNILLLLTVCFQLNFVVSNIQFFLDVSINFKS
jgi:hypothetical protein